MLVELVSLVASTVADGVEDAMDSVVVVVKVTLALTNRRPVLIGAAVLRAAD